ncbi:hypothetical protein PPL_12316 [Heterostelium album PN500]|uniref:Ankyrin repeat protein n=1 Tax=Heterostelium pallidum (strain ATCC 26659 / Pp 5 / PN500) TaxID=670386 RepID=D3BMA6_HETP5|nr:hypothetical protein PPL_12316 [Heterostelium album PN500]EFA77707.1 hypothetical protein PPL_12316 [Heterostelium album PN500]|eukprot:XP_020429835.1 hypothetical protein PPL_12316 [Heterostelium album PN500]
MDNKLFSSLFKNVVINKLIFDNVKSINRLRGEGNVYKWSQVIQLPHVQAGNNYLHLLKESLQMNFGAFQIFRNAVHAGSLEMFEYLLQYYRFTTAQISLDRVSTLKEQLLNSILINASRCNRLDIIECLLRTFPTYRWDFYGAMVDAPYSGNWEILKRLKKLHEQHNNDSDFSYCSVFDSAASVGRLDMIQWLLVNRSEDFEKSEMLIPAIEAGHLPVVEYILREHKELLDKEDKVLVKTAAVNGHLDVLKLLYEEKFSVPDNIVDDAALSGNLKLIKWLQENKIGVASLRAIQSAVTIEDLQTLVWLYHNSSDVVHLNIPFIVKLAVANNHLSVVKWLLENTTTERHIDSETIVNVAKGNYFDMFQFLLKNAQVQIPDNLLDIVVSRGHFKFIKYLHENTTLSCSTNSMDYSCSYGRLEIKDAQTKHFYWQWIEVSLKLFDGSWKTEQRSTFNRSHSNTSTSTIYW